MADTNKSQVNNPQPTQDMNPMSSINGANNAELVKVLKNLTNVLEGKPTSGSSGKKLTATSQSNFADKQSKWEFSKPEKKKIPDYKRTGNIFDDFEQGIKDQLLDSLAGGNLKKGIEGALDTFTKEFGVDIKDLPHEYGKQIGKKLFESTKDSKIGKSLSEKAKKFGNRMLDNLFDSKGADGQAAKSALKNVSKSFFDSASLPEGSLDKGIPGADGVGKVAGDLSGGAGAKVATESMTSVAPEAVAGGSEAIAGATAAGDAMAGLAMAAPEVVVALLAIAVVLEAVSPAIEGLVSLIKAVGGAMVRDEEMREKRMKNAQARLEADIKTIVTRPFDILQQAAEAWASAWDANLATISATQGYDKESVYNLYSAYAERLQQEGLASAIGATDVVDKLGSVLESGLSGKVAEEFAYMATKLNAAIPTEDFFSYASAYSELASSMIASGASQSEAIAYANTQLESFASNLLYSSRELAGGFSTGLKNASDLFTQSVEIARTARTADTTTISGTLTSVSAIIGAVAPDLASGLVSNIVDAAVGGNADSIVALRSLAGINAGNTEFLRQMVENPQAIFSTIFSNLAQMQNMSPDNYMEVAEGLADVFGVDMKAFARVDFDYLASAIDQMNVNNNSLAENMAMLTSGSTKTIAEQQKLQEINQMILDEGLAYVIDNETARVIQQHMWDEQIANELQEATYAVELQGAAMDFLEGISKTVTNIIKFLNPFAFIGKSISSLAATTAEAVGNNEDIREILELGAIGYNADALRNLTTRGEDLGLTQSLVELMGGTKGIAALNKFVNVVDTVTSITSATAGGPATAFALDKMWGANAVSTMFTNPSFGAFLDSLESDNSATSAYKWGTVSKSAVAAIQSSPYNTTDLGAIATNSDYAQFNADQAVAQSNSRFEEFLATAQDSVKDMSYEEWKATARNFGIADFDQALKDFGSEEKDVSALFDEALAKAGAEEEEARAQDELQWRQEARTFWDETRDFWVDTKAYWKDVHDFWDETRIYWEDVHNFWADTKIFWGKNITYWGDVRNFWKEVRTFWEKTESYWGDTNNFWDLKSGTSGLFQSLMWVPFFGANGKFDTRMSALDSALATINTGIGASDSHTVVSGLADISSKLGDASSVTVVGVLNDIKSNISNTFSKSSSAFQKYLATSATYQTNVAGYKSTVSKSSEWSELQNASEEDKANTTLALAKALQEFSASDLQKLDPQLQANALLGQIVILLQAIMQQGNSGGGTLNFVDTLSALGLGATTRSPI